MKFLVISDVHSNWTALEAVLAETAGEYDQVVCCGDLVGYNDKPQAVVDWTGANCSTVIRGNHDKAVAGSDDLQWFNEVAKAAAIWTAAELSEQQLSYLRDLQQGPVLLEHFHLWHGSPRDEDEYITNGRDAAACFSYFERPLAFFGHTHVQGGFLSVRGKVGAIQAPKKRDRERVIELEPDILYMVNAGSVGQPRDGDPRAAYAIYNSEDGTVFLRRVRYDVEQTANGITAAGLPDVLALRLFQGF